jgi:hypothetical protein
MNLSKTLAACALAFMLPALAAAQTATQDPKPAEKAAPAAATTVAGKWAMSLQSPQGAMDVALDVKLDEKNIVTGTLSGPQGPVPIEGELKEGVLGFLISVDGGGGTFSIWFSGSLKEDGTMAGNADMGEMGQMAWTAKRVKS